jgi:hypothetical protein
VAVEERDSDAIRCLPLKRIRRAVVLQIRNSRIYGYTVCTSHSSVVFRINTSTWRIAPGRYLTLFNVRRLNSVRVSREERSATTNVFLPCLSPPAPALGLRQSSGALELGTSTTSAHATKWGSGNVIEISRAVGASVRDVARKLRISPGTVGGTGEKAAEPNSLRCHRSRSGGGSRRAAGEGRIVKDGLEAEPAIPELTALHTRRGDECADQKRPDGARNAKPLTGSQDRRFLQLDPFAFLSA